MCLGTDVRSSETGNRCRLYVYCCMTLKFYLTSTSAPTGLHKPGEDSMAEHHPDSVDNQFLQQTCRWGENLLNNRLKLTNSSIILTLQKSDISM